MSHHTPWSPTLTHLQCLTLCCDNCMAEYKLHNGFSIFPSLCMCVIDIYGCPFYMGTNSSIYIYTVITYITRILTLTLTMYGRYTVCPQTIIFNLLIRVLIQDEHISVLHFSVLCRDGNDSLNNVYLAKSINQSTTQRECLKWTTWDFYNQTIMKILTTERCYNIAFTCMHITCSHMRLYDV